MADALEGETDASVFVHVPSGMVFPAWTRFIVARVTASALKADL